MDVKNISPEQAKVMYDKKVKFIDVRELDENETARIPDTKLIPMSEMQNRWNEISKDEDIVIYCRTGNRSGILISQLILQGYNNLFNLAGGIIEWHQNSFPVEQG
jgi:rhodanese-related sulfurtransferase